MERHGNRGAERAGTEHAPAAGDDWAAKLTKSIEALVELIRDRSVRPVLLAARFAVFGIVAVAGVLVFAIATAIGLVRLFDTLVFSGHVWATDTLVGGIFAVAGVLLMRQGSKEGDDAHA